MRCGSWTSRSGWRNYESAVTNAGSFAGWEAKSMKSLVRRAVIGLSAILWIATIMLWVRSVYVQDLVVRGVAGAHYYEWALIPHQMRFTIVDDPNVHVSLRWYRGNEPRLWPVFGRAPIYRR